MILWGARTNGPALPPGRYTARITADGRSASAPIVVRRNPRITDVTDADLRAQYAFSRQVRDKVTEANEAVIAIRRVKAQVEDRLDRTDAAAIERRAQRLVTDVSAVEADIYQVKNQSNQDPLNFPIKVNNRLANLMSMAERGDGRPTGNMPVIFKILTDELAGYLDRLEVIWKTQLGPLNAELAKKGLEKIDPGCEREDGCQARRPAADR